MSQPHALAVRMAELARAVAVPRSADDILVEVTAAAVELIPGVDTAGVLRINVGGKVESRATTSDLPHQLDALQEMFQEGPCIQAALAEQMVLIEDFREETRWQAYAAAAAKLGVLSGMSFKLYTADRTAGALNLFGFQPKVWSDDDQLTGTVLAAHAAAALLAHSQGDQLSSAVASRDRIGQAKGIIMERFGVDDVRAFDMLRKLSQESNTALIDVAERVIASRRE